MGHYDGAERAKMIAELRHFRRWIRIEPDGPMPSFPLWETFVSTDALRRMCGMVGAVIFTAWAQETMRHLRPPPVYDLALDANGDLALVDISHPARPADR